MRLWALLWLLKSGNNQTSLLVCVTPSSGLVIVVLVQHQEFQGYGEELQEDPALMGDNLNAHFGDFMDQYVSSLRHPSDPSDVEIMTLPKGLPPRAESFFFTKRLFQKKS